MSNRGSILDYFGENFTFSFELSSANGPNTDWLNSEDQIATFDQVWNQIESLITEVDAQSFGTVKIVIAMYTLKTHQPSSLTQKL